MNFRILHYDTLDSTNNLAISFAKAKAAEGTVVVSEFQTQGRGRFDRKWLSPRSKDLLFSLILYPKLKASQTPILTHFAAESVLEVLSSRFHLPARLKKPNDVLIQDKKICGILTESSAVNQKMDYVVVGIGLNVNGEKKDLMDTATSVHIETKKKTDKESLLIDILERFGAKYEETQ